MQVDGVEEVADANAPPDAVARTADNAIMLAFVTAMVHGGGKTDTKEEVSGAGGRRAVLLMNELSVQAPACHRRLIAHQQQIMLPPAFTSALQYALASCTTRPPPNCSAGVYRLIGKKPLLPFSFQHK